jgi:hypothetical protein
MALASSIWEWMASEGLTIRSIMDEVIVKQDTDISISGGLKPTIYKDWYSGKHPLHERRKLKAPTATLQIQNPDKPHSDHLMLSARQHMDPKRVGRYVKYQGFDSPGVTDSTFQNTRNIMIKNKVPIGNAKEVLYFKVYLPTANAAKDSEYLLKQSPDALLSRRAWKAADAGKLVGTLKIASYRDPEEIASTFADEHDLTDLQAQGIRLWTLSIFNDLMLPTRVAINDRASWVRTFSQLFTIMFRCCLGSRYQKS